MHKDTLSRQTRSILYNFKKELKEKNLGVKQLVVKLFQFEKEKFRKT